MEEKIKDILDKLNPYLEEDGGTVEFVKYEDGVCYLKFLGHCASCPMRMMTLDSLFKESLINEIEEITDVKLISD